MFTFFKKIQNSQQKMKNNQLQMSKHHKHQLEKIHPSNTKLSNELEIKRSIFQKKYNNYFNS